MKNLKTISYKHLINGNMDVDGFFCLRTYNDNEKEERLVIIEKDNLDVYYLSTVCDRYKKEGKKEYFSHRDIFEKIGYFMTEEEVMEYIKDQMNHDPQWPWFNGLTHDLVC